MAYRLASAQTPPIIGGNSRHPQPGRGDMSIQFRTKDLSPVEISFLKWQYGFEEEDDPFERSL